MFRCGAAVPETTECEDFGATAEVDSLLGGGNIDSSERVVAGPMHLRSYWYRLLSAAMGMSGGLNRSTLAASEGEAFEGVKIVDTCCRAILCIGSNLQTFPVAFAQVGLTAYDSNAARELATG